MNDRSDALIAKLIRRLHDTDPRARRNAAGALRLHGDRAVVAARELRGLLGDEDAKVRAEAQRALAQLRQPAA